MENKGSIETSIQKNKGLGIGVSLL
jgi:hypothetical protein